MTDETRDTEPIDVRALTEKLYGTTEADVWAAEFMAIFGGRLGDIDEGLMIAWFANAMATATRVTLEENPERRPAHDSDFVLLPRDALFEFLGAVALPPWQDADGSLIGSEIDCAPIATRLSDWVARHDLGDLYRRLGDD